MIHRLIITVRHAIAIWRVLSHPKNRYKGHWGSVPPQALLLHACDELRELSAEVWAHSEGKGNVEAVVSEAADVSAFLAMLVDNVRRRTP